MKKTKSHSHIKRNRSVRYRAARRAKLRRARLRQSGGSRPYSR